MLRCCPCRHHRCCPLPRCHLCQSPRCSRSCPGRPGRSAAAATCHRRRCCQFPRYRRYFFWSPCCCCCVAALPPLHLRLLFWSPRKLPRCRCYPSPRCRAAAAAFSPLLPMSPSALLLHCCPTPRCGCYRRRSASNGAGAAALPPCFLQQRSSAARGQLEGLGFSPKAHPLPPLARTLCCLVLVGSPLNFAGYLLRDGRELRKTSHGFLKRIT